MQNTGSFNIKTLLIVVGLVAICWGLFSWLLGGPKQETKATAQAEITSSTTDDVDEVVDDYLPKPRERRMGSSTAKQTDEEAKLLAQIDTLLRDGRSDEAIRLLETVLKKDPQNERALEELGMIYMTERQDVEKAVGYFKRVLETNPNNEFALMELVGASTHPARSDEAIKYLKELHGKNSDSPVLADGLGELLLSQGRLAESIPYLQQSAKDPRYAEFAHSRMASVYQQMGEPDKAMGEHRKAILMQSKEIERRKKDGFPIEMIEADKARSQFDLANMLIDAGKTEEARELLEQARTTIGDGPEYDAAMERMEAVESL